MFPQLPRSAAVVVGVVGVVVVVVVVGSSRGSVIALVVVGV